MGPTTATAVRAPGHERLLSFLDETPRQTPYLAFDTGIAADRYQRIATAFDPAGVFYAVKANPLPELVRLLVGLGACFDVASRAEIDLCLAAGADPATLSYGNTVKKATDIAYAHRRGIRLFVFDSESELAKLAEHAPGASVLCRLLASSDGARWPLSRKFGCEPRMAVDLLERAQRLGLDPHGIAFHVGSQQLHPERWDPSIAQAAGVFAELRARDVQLRTLNIGGGFPVGYTQPVLPIEAYAQTILESVERHFGPDRPAVMLEPGRYVCAEAGVLRTEVVLVSRKSYEEERRWVYLDVGRFGGLAETEGEAIQYQLVSSRDGARTGPVVIAGPTCDSVDILYQRADYRLPLDLAPGDHVDVLAAGAYTTTYSSVAFNGFPPLATHCVTDPESNGAPS